MTSLPSQPAERLASQDETRFDWGARLLLLFALIFIVCDVAQVAYRFGLPTEGWEVQEIDGPDSQALYMGLNIVGAPSPLLPGDVLQTIGGFSTEQLLDSSTLLRQPPAGWADGGQVEISVVRNGQHLTFNLPVVRWTPAAWLRVNLFDLGGLIGWLAALLVLAVGLFTFRRRPGNFAARFLFLFGLAGIAIVVSDSLPDTLAIYFNLPAALGKALFSNVIFAYLFAPAVLGFALTFPQRKVFIQRRPLLLLAPFLLGLVVLWLLFIAPDLAEVGFPVTLGLVVAAIGALLHSGWTVRSAVSRAQMRWVIGGGILGLGLFTLNFWNYPNQFPGPLSAAILVLASLGPLVLGVSVAVAILRYRLFDIDILIRRTLIYAVLTGLLALAYFGSVIAMQTAASALTGQQQSTLVTVLSTLVIAALFVPLRRGVQTVIDRRLYRRKYDAARTLTAFGAALRAEVELAHLSDELVEIVEASMQPAHVSLWLKPAADRQNAPGEQLT